MFAPPVLVAARALAMMIRAATRADDDAIWTDTIKNRYEKRLLEIFG